MIRTIIIDDEKAGREVLADLLNRYCNNIEVVAMANNVQSGIEAIRTHKPALVFLDIEMPNQNGFELLETLQPIDFKVIFVTAYNQFALKAIKYSAIDYLLKPIDDIELKRAIAKVETFNSNENKSLQSQIQEFVENYLKPEKAFEKLGIPTIDGLEFVLINDIIRCEAEGNYTNIYLVNGTKILSSKTLKQYETLLEGTNFIRIHHAHLINTIHVKKYIKGEGGHVVMSDGTTVDVSKRKKTEFLNKVNNF